MVAATAPYQQASNAPTAIKTALLSVLALAHHFGGKYPPPPEGDGRGRTRSD